MGDKKPLPAVHHHVSPTLKLPATKPATSFSPIPPAAASPKTTISSSITSPSPAVAPTAVARAQFYNQKTKRMEDVEVPTAVDDGGEGGDFTKVKKRKMNE